MIWSLNVRGQEKMGVPGKMTDGPIPEEGAHLPFLYLFVLWEPSVDWMILPTLGMLDPEEIY